MAQSAAEEAKLLEELVELSSQQSEALHTSIFIAFNEEELCEYKKRRVRIAEICKLLDCQPPKRD